MTAKSSGPFRWPAFGHWRNHVVFTELELPLDRGGIAYATLLAIPIISSLFRVTPKNDPVSETRSPRSGNSEEYGLSPGTPTGRQCRDRSGRRSPPMGRPDRGDGDPQCVAERRNVTTTPSRFAAHPRRPTAKLGEMFVVGGEECPYPGHRSLSAEERVNCRCTFVSTAETEE